MKRLQLILIAILFILQSNNTLWAQNNQIVSLSHGNTWVYEQFFYDNWTEKKRIVTKEIVRDTLINDLEYKVLVATEYLDGTNSGDSIETLEYWFADEQIFIIWSNNQIYSRNAFIKNLQNDTSWVDSSSNRNFYHQIVKFDSNLFGINYPLQKSITTAFGDKIYNINEHWTYYCTTALNIGPITFFDSLYVPGPEIIIVTKKNLIYSIIDGVVWGDTNFTSIKKNNSLNPTFSLQQNYPNPFNPMTTIKYSLKEAGIVNLSIYNILGEMIKQPVNQYKEKGNYSFSLNASNLSSGVYFYKLSVNEFTSIKKMVVTK